MADSTSTALSRFSGLKALFIQDEYDYTYRAWVWIKRLGIHLVFTVVPPGGMDRIYPSERFPGVRFVSNITGYVPEGLPPYEAVHPPSTRALVVGYRGRLLPLRYGRLGQEKAKIGRLVKNYCVSNHIPHDIAWDEDSRIYGPKWYDFIMSCRAVLGSESGSNVFDWDGTLDSQVKAFRHSRRNATEEEIYREVIKRYEIDGLMNQVSPRVFEAIALRAVLVLFEGNYSGVLTPEQHYIPLKKDGTNIDTVFSLLQEARYVDEITDRAYREIIVPGKYDYRSFVRMVDEEIIKSFQELGFYEPLRSPEEDFMHQLPHSSSLTNRPVRVLRPQDRNRATRIAYKAWNMLPKTAKKPFKPMLKKLFGGEVR